MGSGSDLRAGEGGDEGVADPTPTVADPNDSELPLKGSEKY